MSLKRNRGDMETNIANMAKCLMLLSRGRGGGGGGGGDHQTTAESMMMMTQSPKNRVFECKTCNRQFPSFQALGGHRASHKKPRLMDSADHDHQNNQVQMSQRKPKIHECSICGLEFAIGQALGGHMRRHRAALNEATAAAAAAPPAGLSNSSCSSLSDPPPPKQQQQQSVPVLKRSNSRRILCLDLNLSPPDHQSNDFEFSSSTVGKITPSPMIHCFI